MFRIQSHYLKRKMFYEVEFGYADEDAAARIVNLAGGARFIITFSSETPFKGLFYLGIEAF